MSTPQQRTTACLGPPRAGTCRVGRVWTLPYWLRLCTSACTGGGFKKEAVVGFDHYVRALGDPHYLLPFVAGVGLVWAAYRLRAALASPILATGSSERSLRPLYVRIVLGRGRTVGTLGGIGPGVEWPS